jgi:hypothetical protein
VSSRNCHVVAYWHLCDMPERPDNVRCSALTGSGWQGVKTELLTHPGHGARVPMLLIIGQ